MKCPKCNYENEENAMFCLRCGSPMHQVENKEKDASSIILFIWAVCMFLCILSTSIITSIIPRFNDCFTNNKALLIIYFYYGISIFQDLLYLVPAFAIKNMFLKIIGIIVMTIAVIWRIYNTISFLLLQLQQI